MLKLNSHKMLLQQIERFWQIDIYGTENSAELSQSENTNTLQILEKGHFEVPLLWKNFKTFYQMQIKE